MLRNFIGHVPSLPGHIGRRQLAFYEPDTGANPAGGQGGQGDPAAALQNLITRHNNDMRAVVDTLFRENYDYRRQNAELRGQLPAQGAVVLSSEDATRWQSYQQLGALDALQQQLQTASVATTELAGMRRSALLRDVADVAGYKPAVLTRLAGDMAMEIRETTVDGKQARTVVVKDGDKEVALADYAKTHWSDFLPSLQAAQQQSAGTTFVRQDAGGQAPASPLDAYAKRFQEQRDAALNPLAPPAARPPLG